MAEASVTMKTAPYTANFSADALATMLELMQSAGIAISLVGATIAADQIDIDTADLEAKLDTVAGLLDIGGGPAVSITRPDNTDAYTANDVIGHATDATAAIEFTSVGASGGRVMITSASLMISLAAIPSGMTSFRLYLYSVTPPSALADNAAWDLPASDRASFLGYIDLGSPVDLGSTLYVEANGINKQVKLAGTSLFGYLVTNGAYTPASQTIYKVTLNTTGV